MGKRERETDRQTIITEILDVNETSSHKPSTWRQAHPQPELGKDMTSQVVPQIQGKACSCGEQLFSARPGAGAAHGGTSQPPHWQLLTLLRGNTRHSSTQSKCQPLHK